MFNEGDMKRVEDPVGGPRVSMSLCQTITDHYTRNGMGEKLGVV